MTGEKYFLHALAAFRPFISALRLQELVQTTGSFEKAWQVEDSKLSELGWNEEQKQKFKEHRSSWRLERNFELLSSYGISIISFNDGTFPVSLKNIFDPPLALYVRGTIEADSFSIGFVGSRKATPYGKTATNILVRPLASRGITIVSGLAYGIDAEAHRATLSVNGKTIAVLGNGIDEATLYPRAHRDLAREIVDKGGAVISEYPPATKPQGYFFPQRNRIISGLSKAIVVVEAGERSGALITAKEALEQNRDVFAVPGPITSELSKGTNRLIKEGAAPIQSAEDLVESLELADFLKPEVKQILPENHDKSLPKSDTDIILRILTREPLAIDEIVKRSTLSPNVVASCMTLLEMDNIVRDVGSKSYVKV